MLCLWWYIFVSKIFKNIPLFTPWFKITMFSPLYTGTSVMRCATSPTARFWSSAQMVLMKKPNLSRLWSKKIYKDTLKATIIVHPGTRRCQSQARWCWSTCSLATWWRQAVPRGMFGSKGESRPVNNLELTRQCGSRLMSWSKKCWNIAMEAERTISHLCSHRRWSRLGRLWSLQDSPAGQLQLEKASTTILLSLEAKGQTAVTFLCVVWRSGNHWAQFTTQATRKNSVFWSQGQLCYKWRCGQEWPHRRGIVHVLQSKCVNEV